MVEEVKSPEQIKEKEEIPTIPQKSLIEVLPRNKRKKGGSIGKGKTTARCANIKQYQAMSKEMKKKSKRPPSDPRSVVQELKRKFQSGNNTGRVHLQNFSGHSF